MAINQTIRGVLSINNGSSTGTAIIPTVATGKADLRKLGDDAPLGTSGIYLQLQDATHLLATRVGTSLTKDVAYDLTEWT